MYKILPAEPTPEMWKAALAVRLLKRGDEGVPHPLIDRVEAQMVWDAFTGASPSIISEQEVREALQDHFSGITFNMFSEVNLARAKRWHKGSIMTWLPERWSNAAAGEMGECCNAVKKLNRLEDEMQQHAGDTETPVDVMAAKKKIAKEACDTIVYLNLLIQRLGLNPEAELRNCFNSISEREGFPERI